MTTSATMIETIDRVRAEEESKRLEWERTTVVLRIDDRDVTIADLRAAFEDVQNSAGWKHRIIVTVPAERVAITAAAIEYYHGAPPVLMAEHERPDGRLERVILSHGYAG